MPTACVQRCAAAGRTASSATSDRSAVTASPEPPAPDLPTDVQAAIYGCAGPRLSAWERDFLKDARPFGAILFARNCETPDQVRALVAELRSAAGRALPVMIDQEGGRVQRLKPPHWPRHRPAGALGELAQRQPADAVAEVVRWWAGAIALDLVDLGIDVDATPVADLHLPGAHDIIGDRSFGASPDLVARLGRVVCETMVGCGLLPIIKHLPGHGRAREDSHHALPVVDADLDTLIATDFAAFAGLADQPWGQPWGMTAHVVYTALDPANAATVSPTVIGETIRGRIGFDGLLLSDDLSMQALAGPLAQRAAASLAAGCDIALHCTGDAAEMVEVAGAVGSLSAAARTRAQRAERQRRAALAAAVPFDATPADLRSRVDAALSTP
ncbi:MAG: beta-N-acetylhexosaminidase [Rhodospirillaceae bacterium]|nr:beta-N-acetylhexosaminidase [Rhodospirillaceae bacterium]